MGMEKFKLCPECGKRNPPSLLECRYCEADLTGVKLADNTAQQTKEPDAQVTPASTETTLVRICECGAENAPQARKCSVCGEDISDILPVRIPGRAKNRFSYELKSVDGAFAVTIDRPLCVIGREADLSDYLASHVYVSRRHAKFTVAAETVFIENLSGTNKTYLNNTEIPDGTPTPISSGDEIGLGGKVVDGCRQEKAAYFIFQVRS